MVVRNSAPVSHLRFRGDGPLVTQQQHPGPRSDHDRVAAALIVPMLTVRCTKGIGTKFKS